MARPESEKAKRRKTVESLKKAMEANKMSEKFLEDKVDEYMSFYDDLKYINSKLMELKQVENCPIKAYTDAVSEKRRISNEMRNILTFLGLKPTDVQLSAGSGDNEEL